MNAKSIARWSAIVILGLAAAGCQDPRLEPSEEREQMLREATLIAPTVGGPSRELMAEAEPARLAEAAAVALKDAGVRLVREGKTDAGQWLLGQSLAQRQVLVQILPIYPGRSSIKVTVEGADALTRDLLDRLATDIGRKVR
jgi:hypothetical protein